MTSPADNRKQALAASSFGSRFAPMNVCIFALLFAAAVLGIAHAGSAVTNVMPELYVTLPNEYCSIHFRSTDSNFAKRRDRIFRTFSKLYQGSEGWSKSYGIVGADYLNFEGFDLVAFSSCSDTRKVNGLISDESSLDKSYLATIVGRSKLVSSVALLNSRPSAVARFRHFNPTGDLASCTFALQTVRRNNFSIAQMVETAVTKAWLEFRLPFADVREVNDKIFVLMSRDCNKKREIFSGLRYATMQNGLNLDDFVRFEASPDVIDYIRAQPHDVNDTAR